MSTIHDQIRQYIEGQLSDDEIDRLWMNYLHQPIWYDYFITELTAKKVIHTHSSNEHTYVDALWNKVTNSPKNSIHINAR